MTTLPDGQWFYHTARGDYEVAMIKKKEPWIKFHELTLYQQAAWIANAGMEYQLSVARKQEPINDDGLKAIGEAILNAKDIT